MSPQHVYREFQDCVADYPTAAMLAAFGAGLGLGVLAGVLMVDSPRPQKWYERIGADHHGRRLMEGLSSLVGRDS